MRRGILALPALVLAAALAGCGGGFGFGFFDALGSEPGAARPGVVDANAAARLISGYRASRGLGPLTIDAKLSKIAADHAERMAAMDRMSHVLPGEGSFQQRIAAGGFDAKMAAENVAAGQDSLAEVFDAWRKSPGHNSNMLLNGISRMGIALAITESGRYHTYWALVLGEPRAPRAGGPPPGSPAMMMAAP